MSRSKFLVLLLAAGAIFAFVAVTSDVQAFGSLGEKIRETQNTEEFIEAGGNPMSTEVRREATEWQREFTNPGNEFRQEFEEFIEPPTHGTESERESENAIGGFEELREGPLNTGGGGGGGCNYSGGWCPPSCMSCSGGFPPAY
ncbi:MAG: hypothetical protein AAF604_10775 [Acidobacteriota bacterium]